MDWHYDFYLRLLKFRNIDLPSQGVYFLQLRFDSVPARTVVVPYSCANSQECPRGSSGTPINHSLFPPQIAIDDAMQSTGYIIQFSDEEVRLTDAFRISIKEEVTLVAESGRPRFYGTSSTEALTLFVELLFSNANDVGGLEHILASPESSVFPTEFIVVASQKLILGPPGKSQYFRLPLALLREQDTIEEETSERLSGEIFPCSFIEGLVVSSFVKLELTDTLETIDFKQFSTLKSDELRLHPLDIEEGIVGILHDAEESQMTLLADLGLSGKVGITNPCSKLSADSDTEMLGGIGLLSKLELLSSNLFLSWNSILENFPRNLSTAPFRAAWRNALVGKCNNYIRGMNCSRARGFNPDTSQVFSYPLRESSVPILHTDTRLSSLLSPPRGHGSHLVVLVHGYQGSTSDMRIIRNIVACLCPEAMIFCSSANEGQTDGDVESMGLRLAMELKDFLMKQSSSFSIIARISFIGHSLGGLIIRAAVALLGEYREKMHLYLSLSTPHLGITNKLIESGIAFLRLFRKAELFEQLTHTDAEESENTFLFRCSNLRSLNWFHRVVFVGSRQDQYASLATATLCPSPSDKIGIQLSKNTLSKLSETKVLKFDINFDIDETASLDSVIGRAAHIKFLESPVIIQMLILANSDMFDI